MANEIIWASEAEDQDIQAPSAEKQKVGWSREIPPHEHFNWYMNRTDKRLHSMEQPLFHSEASFMASSRTEVIRAGERFDLPAAYRVGANQLRVYLDGLLCYEGEDQQYVECGEPGTDSTYIRWNDDIDVTHDIKIVIPLRGTTLATFYTQAVSADAVARDVAGLMGAGGLLPHAESHFTGGQDAIDPRSIGAVSQYDPRLQDSRNPKPHTHATADIEGLETYVLSRAMAVTAVQRTDAVMPSVQEASAEYEVPAYIVGSGTLDVYINGLLAAPGVDYVEVGEAEATSDRIAWVREIAQDTRVTIKTPVLAVGG